MPELRTQVERDQVLRKFKVSTTAVCNRCEQPIKGLVYVDPKGGYYPKPDGTPDFLARLAKVTYDRDCFDQVRGRKPKPQAQQTPTSTAPGTQQPLAPTSKLLRKLAQKVIDTIRADRKRQWKVWDIVCMLKPIASQGDIRAACNWLKKERVVAKKQGRLIVTKRAATL